MVSGSTQRFRRQLAASRLFGALDTITLESLARSARSRDYRRGDRLWAEGDRADRFTVIQSGLVKIVRLLPDCSETLIGVFGPHESIGDVAVCGTGIYPASAVVASDTATAITVPADQVRALGERRADVAAALNQSMVCHTQVLHSKIAVMSAGSVVKRLATLLLCFADRFGDELESGEVLIPVQISRTELASLIGARVETTIRAVRPLERDGILETDSRGLVIHDLAALSELTEGTDRAPQSGDAPAA